MSPSPSSPVDPQLQRLRRELAEALWRGMLLIALVGVPISCSRALFTGWLPTYSLHAVVGTAVVGIALNRRRLPYAWLAGLLMSLLWVVGLPGLFAFGLMSAGPFWLALSCFLATQLYSVRVGVAMAGVATLMLAGAGLGFMSGGLTSVVDERLYQRQPGAWATLLFVTGGFLFFVLRSLGHHQRAVALLMSELRRSHEEVSDLYDHAPCGYHALDADGRVLRINQTELRWLGRSAEDVVGRPFVDFLAPGSRGFFELSAHRFRRDGRIDDLEFELLHRDGSTRPVLVSATAVLDADGRFQSSRTTLFDITERKKLEARLDQLARTDSLTGLRNRRDFRERAAIELARARRLERPLALCMIDIDHFKRVNERHGHLGGDRVLRAVGAALAESLREIDLLARLGGEEFVILLPEAALGAAMDVAERLRERVAALRVDMDEGEPARVTVSIGVSSIGPADFSVETLLQRADQALYAVKRSGRNGVRAQAAPGPLLDEDDPVLPPAPQLR